MEKLKRYIVFIIGMFVCAVGVVLVTKSDLGASAVASIPYVLSLIFPVSMGKFTMAFGLTLVLLQLIILGRGFKAEYLLQIPIYIVFGSFIDLCEPLFAFVAPQSYIAKFIVMLLGCVIIAVSVYLEVIADVAMLPAESFVRAVVKRWGTEFGVTKICFDVSISLIAAALSLICLGQLRGVREGTLVAAVFIGWVTRQLKKLFRGMPEKLFK